MEVHFAPEIEKKLHELVAQSGVTADEFVRDVVEGYFEDLVRTRAVLDGRYDDLKSGRVELVAGDEVAARFRDKSAGARGLQRLS